MFKYLLSATAAAAFVAIVAFFRIDGSRERSAVLLAATFLITPYALTYDLGLFAAGVALIAGAGTASGAHWRVQPWLLALAMLLPGIMTPLGELKLSIAPAVITAVLVLALIQAGMRDVVFAPEGTAYHALRQSPGGTTAGPTFSMGGKTGTAEFGELTEEGTLPFHSWFVAYLPSAAGATDAELAVLSFNYSAVVPGNVSAEVVKYFLQLHYDLDQDLRLDPNDFSLVTAN